MTQRSTNTHDDFAATFFSNFEVEPLDITEDCDCPSDCCFCPIACDCYYDLYDFETYDETLQAEDEDELVNTYDGDQPKFVSMRRAAIMKRR